MSVLAYVLGACPRQSELLAVDATLPPKTANGLELGDCQSAPLVAGLRARRCQRGDHGLALSLVDRCGIEVGIEQHKKHGIEFFLDVDGTDTLTWLAVVKQATPLDLEAANTSFVFLGRVVTGLSRRQERHSENAGGLVFGNLAGDPKGLARQGAEALRQLLGVRQDFKDGIGRHVLALSVPAS